MKSRSLNKPLGLILDVADLGLRRKVSDSKKSNPTISTLMSNKSAVSIGELSNFSQPKLLEFNSIKEKLMTLKSQLKQDITNDSFKMGDREPNRNFIQCATSLHSERYIPPKDKNEEDKPRKVRHQPSVSSHERYRSNSTFSQDKSSQISPATYRPTNPSNDLYKIIAERLTNNQTLQQLESRISVLYNSEMTGKGEESPGLSFSRTDTRRKLLEYSLAVKRFSEFVDNPQHGSEGPEEVKRR